MDLQKYRSLLEYLNVSRQKYFVPTYEIYSEVDWEQEYVKNLIKQKRLSPIFAPEYEKTKTATQECLICYNFFPILNMSMCCKKPICTECYLQIRPHKCSKEQDLCPFCRQKFFKVFYTQTQFLWTSENDGENDEKIVELEMKAMEKDRRLFEEQTKKIRGEMLKIREREEKEGLYKKEFRKMRMKKKKQKRTKRLFKRQLRRQRRSSLKKSNYSYSGSDLSDITNSSSSSSISESESEQEQEQEQQQVQAQENLTNLERIQQMYTNINNLNRRERAELEDLMMQESLRISMEQN
ncbi:protein sip5 [Anaeramoeba flamelloides]|uniref:Protein sip5 n=1 Tax=Anaeramoeba flamelloides TaxID=1746091 RepID=A0ABQ8Y322_9EUKA|nr:protein sip5 [Anaeramoeba flamelloides]